MSERAVEVGAVLARRLSADLQLVRSSWGSSDGEVRSYLDQVRRRFDLDATVGQIIHRFPADAMHDVALEHDDPVLVLASHGRSGWGHALLGSLSEEILARAGAPVFVVGPEATTKVLDATGNGGPHRLGWCIDRATDPHAVLPFCEKWANRLQLDVEVLTVEEEDDRPISRFHAASGAQVDAAVAGLMAVGVRAHGQVLEELQPARCLAEFATDHDLALLVADKRSGSGIAREALGSTAMNLVRQSPCPVLFPPHHEHS